MKKEIDPMKTSRAAAFKMWMNIPNPMVTFIKTIDVTNLVRISRKKHLKFNMLMDYCIGRAAAGIREFYTLPVGNKLMRYDSIAVSLIINNKKGGINSCDILFSEELKKFNRDYNKYTSLCSVRCTDRDLNDNCMVIGTSAIVDTELDGAVGIYSGIYNNPYIIWDRYRKKLFRYYLTLSFQFHHTQMDGRHAGQFLNSLQTEINRLK